MTAPDIFALGGRQDELLQLFHQWVESERRAEAYGDEHPEDDDPQYLRLCAVGLELAYQIIATPAKSAVDLAIKAYMLGWHESGGSSDDAPAVSGLSDPFLISLLRDLPTFVPEMAALLVHAEGSP